MTRQFELGASYNGRFNSDIMSPRGQFRTSLDIWNKHDGDRRRRVGAGAKFIINPEHDIFVRYEGLFNQDYSSHGIMARWTSRF